MKNEYDIQAENFAKKFNVKLSVIGDLKYKKYFHADKESRYVFKLRLTRDKKSYTFSFGQSIAAGAEYPKLYDILACLTKYDPESFENFCSEYGYDEDSRKAENTWKACKRSAEKLARIYDGDIYDLANELQEIAG